MGLCFCCKSKDPTSKVNTADAGFKKTDFEPYISGQPEKGTEWKKAASKNKKRREELNPFCDMEFSMETDKSGMQKDKGFLEEGRK